MYSASGNRIVKTQNKVFTDEKPNLSNLRIFECKSYVHIPKQRRRKKLSNRLQPGNFVGYDPVNCYRILLAEGIRYRIVASKHVCFGEKRKTTVENGYINESITQFTANDTLCDDYLTR